MRVLFARSARARTESLGACWRSCVACQFVNYVLTKLGYERTDQQKSQILSALAWRFFVREAIRTKHCINMISLQCVCVSIMELTRTGGPICSRGGVRRFSSRCSMLDVISAHSGQLIVCLSGAKRKLDECSTANRVVDFDVL